MKPSDDPAGKSMLRTFRRTTCTVSRRRHHVAPTVAFASPERLRLGVQRCGALTDRAHLVHHRHQKTAGPTNRLTSGVPEQSRSKLHRHLGRVTVRPKRKTGRARIPNSSPAAARLCLRARRHRRRRAVAVGAGWPDAPWSHQRDIVGAANGGEPGAGRGTARTPALEHLGRRRRCLPRRCERQ